MQARQDTSQALLDAASPESGSPPPASQLCFGSFYKQIVGKRLRKEGAQCTQS